MSSTGDEDACGKECGQIRLEWLEEMFQLFPGWSLSKGREEELLDKLNDISLKYSVIGEVLINGLIAFGLNRKCNGNVTTDLLNEYEHHLLKSKADTAATLADKSAPAKSSSSVGKALRGALKELSFRPKLASRGGALAASDTQISSNDLLGEDFINEDYPHSGDDDGASPSPPRKRAPVVEERNAISRSSYRGKLFDASSHFRAGSSAPMELKVLSSCRQEDYCCGSDSKLHEDLEDLLYVDWAAEESPDAETPDQIKNGRQGERRDPRELRLVGAVFPSEGRILTWDNCVFYSLQPPKRVPLNFDALSGGTLFPGKHKIDNRYKPTVQKLVLYGIPSDDGHFLRVNRIEGAPAPPMAGLAMASPLRVLIACGPFSASLTGEEEATLDGNFDKLLKQALMRQVDALILVGPFVPSTGATSSKWTAAEQFDAHMKAVETQLLQRSNEDLRVLVIPNSTADVLAMPQFPTPPYDSNTQPHDQITFLPDPAVFELGGIRFAITASEVLLHLSRRELHRSANKENEDRMQRLITHLINSCSLYPLQPSDEAIGFTMSGSQSKLAIEDCPHILIVPSVLQPCVKIVEHCVVMNPGRLFKGPSTTAGSFAYLEVNPTNARVPTMQPGSVAENVKADILSLR